MFPGVRTNTVGRYQRVDRRKDWPRLVRRTAEICKLMPLKILSCRVTRVCSCTFARAQLVRRFCCCNTFCPWQTAPRASLPGNCWRHRPSIYSVIEVRSHLAVTSKARFLHLGPHGWTPRRGSANYSEPFQKAIDRSWLSNVILWWLKYLLLRIIIIRNVCVLIIIKYRIEWIKTIFSHKFNLD